MISTFVDDITKQCQQLCLENKKDYDKKSQALLKEKLKIEPWNDFLSDILPRISNMMKEGPTRS